MIRLLHILAFVIMAGFSTGAVATQLLDPSAPPSTPAVRETPKASDAAPKVPETLWLVRCEDIKDKGKYCEAFQNLSVKKKENDPAKRLAEFAIGYGGVDKKKKAQAAIILPLGVLVSQDLVIEVDGKEEAKAEIRYCEISGCYAFTEIPDAALKKMSKGEKMTIKGKAANGQNLHIVMGLKGFSAALAQLRG
jgi:invasion protein IalB